MKASELFAFITYSMCKNILCMHLKHFMCAKSSGMTSICVFPINLH